LRKRKEDYVVTIEDVREKIKHYKRLELAGVDLPTVDTGPPVILWIADWSGNEIWEVLSELAATLTVADFAQSGEVAKAAIYPKPPASVPLEIIRKHENGTETLLYRYYPNQVPLEVIRKWVAQHLARKIRDGTAEPP